MATQPDEADATWYPLGCGVHSVVWRTRRPWKFQDGGLVQDKTAMNVSSVPLFDLGNWCAVKVVYDNRSMPPHDIMHEAAVLSKLSNRNIITNLGLVRGGPDAPFALYMPLIPLSLTVLLSSPHFTPEPITGPYSVFARPVLAPSQQSEAAEPFTIVTKSLIYQILLSISYLHSLDPPISHRDINPGNILIDWEGTVKLIDFGLAWEERSGPPPKAASTQISPSPAFPKDWKETREEMCCQVATGPHRAPELLFSPLSYSAVAVDLWSLGTTIAQFFTPLQLTPSKTSSLSPISETSSDIDEVVSEPFIIPPNLRKDIDYCATWQRRTLFDGERGELGLAWSIFRLCGTPTEETWPSFRSLPDASKIEFREASPKPLESALPHLPTSALTAESSRDASPVSLIDALLVYPPASRLPAAQALQHPWFSTELVLPVSHPGSKNTICRTQGAWVTTWGGKNLGEWLEPSLKRETSKMTRTAQ